VNLGFDFILQFEGIYSEAGDASGKTEIAYLDVAIFVDQNVGRLYVPMQNLSRMDPL